MTKLAIVVAALFLTGVAMAVNAEERPTKFIHQITEDVQIVLTPDQCNAKNVQKGWVAYAENGKGDRATGCWIHGMKIPNMPEVVEIHLELDGNFFDYRLYKDKFEARY